MFKTNSHLNLLQIVLEESKTMHMMVKKQPLIYVEILFIMKKY